MDPITIEQSFVCAPKGDWITRPGQPVATLGAPPESHPLPGSQRGLRPLLGMRQPDCGHLCRVTLQDNGWFADARTPAVTRLFAHLPINVVTDKLLLAPEEIRESGFLKRLIPLTSFRAFCVTRLKGGWVVVGTTSPVTAITVAAGEILTVRPEAIVAWCGASPQRFCPKIRLRDVVLPRPSADLYLQFSGEATVWVEGASPTAPQPFRKQG